MKKSRMQKFGLLITFSTFFAAGALANPQNGTIRYGDITIEDFGESLRILQESDRAIIEWEKFSIGVDEITEFLQPGSDAAILNRVTGGSASAINGLLEANGRVLLINPNGVLIGPSGRIDTAGFLASTLDLSDNDFLGGGDLLFSGGSTAAIVNLGAISASDGDIFLIANQVSNQGTLSAPNGTVGLAAGSEVLLAESGNERMFVRGGSGAVGVDNSGAIEAQVAELKAGGSIYSTAIRNSGRVRATGVQREGGRIFLRAGGSKIVNQGELDASQTVEIDAGIGGNVDIEAGSQVAANQVNLKTEGGMISQMGSVVGRTQPDQPSRVEMNAGIGGSILASDGSITAADEILVTAEGGIANFDMGSRMEAGNFTASATGGTIRAAGEIVGRGDVLQPSQISLEANEGGLVEITETGIVRGDGINVSANQGRIDHRGMMIGENGGTVSMRADQGLINIHPFSSIEGGTVAVEAIGGSISHSGTIKANDGEGNGGTVLMNAGKDGSVEVFGMIDAVGNSGQGGSITVTGEEVAIRAGAVLNASGSEGGGTIQVGGSYQGSDSSVFNSQKTIVEAGAMLKADATDSGAGGTVVVWSDGETIFSGTISARGTGGGSGGFAEVSGKRELTFGGVVDLGADDGAPEGTLLLDPINFTIDDAGGVNAAKASDIIGTLGSGTNVTILTDGDTGVGEAGHVWVKEAIQVDNPGNQIGIFTILAHGDINVERNIQLGGNGGAVNLIAGWDGASGFGASMPPGPGQVNHTDNLPSIEEIMDDGAYGTGGQGSVLINPGATWGEIWVGSQSGQTAIFGHDVSIEAGSGIGFIAPGNDSVTGEISVFAKNDVLVNHNGGTSTEITGIGHRAMGGGTIDGAIHINAGRDIKVATNGMQDVMIGHYGMGAIKGNLTLNANAGTVSVDSSAGSKVQIGHESSVSSLGDTVVDADMIGLNASAGGDVIVGSSGGPGEGAVVLRGKNGIALQDESVGTGEWKIGHQGGVGGNSPVIFMGKDVSVDADIAGRVVEANIDGGNVTVGAYGMLNVNSAISYDSKNSLNLVAAGNLNVNAAITTTKRGDISLIAGWDGNTGIVKDDQSTPDFDVSALKDDLYSFGDSGAVDVSGNITTNDGMVGIFGQEILVNQQIDPGQGKTVIYLSDHDRYPGGEYPTGGLVDLKAGVGDAMIMGSNNDDELIIDDSGLDTGSPVTYTIRNGSVSRNPSYSFSGIEQLSIVGGGDDTTFDTQFFSFGQNLNGGGGTNVLNIAMTASQQAEASMGNPIFVSGLGAIGYNNVNLNVEDLPTGDGGGTIGGGGSSSGEGPGNGGTGPGLGGMGGGDPNGEGGAIGNGFGGVEEQIGSQLQNRTEEPGSENDPNSENGESTMQQGDNADDGDGNDDPNKPNQASNAAGNNEATPPGEQRQVDNESGVQETTGNGTTTVDPPAPVDAELNNQLGPQGQADFGSTGLNIN